MVSGSRYKPVRSGVLIGIKKILRWTFKDSLDDKFIDEIVKAEGFSTFEEFWAVLKKINGLKLKRDTPLYTHFYDLYSVWEACDLKP